MRLPVSLASAMRFAQSERRAKALTGRGSHLLLSTPAKTEKNYRQPTAITTPGLGWYDTDYIGTVVRIRQTNNKADKSFTVED